MAQPYGIDLSRAQAFADQHGLTFEVLDDEGWWFPGRCLVVVWGRKTPTPQTRPQAASGRRWRASP
jgi:hypothetical protein